MERARNTLAVDVIVTAYFTKDQTFLCCSDPNQLFCWSEHIDFWVQMSQFNLH